MQQNWREVNRQYHPCYIEVNVMWFKITQKEQGEHIIIGLSIITHRVLLQQSLTIISRQKLRDCYSVIFALVHQCNMRIDATLHINKQIRSWWWMWIQNRTAGSASIVPRDEHAATIGSYCCEANADVMKSASRLTQMCPKHGLPIAQAGEKFEITKSNTYRDCWRMTTIQNSLH